MCSGDAELTHVSWGVGKSLVLPRGRRKLQISGLRLYLGRSLRGRLLRHALWFMSRSGILDRFFPAIQSPSPHLSRIDWRSWVREVLGGLGCRRGAAAFRIPINTALERAVALFMKDDGTPIGIAKMGLADRTAAIAKREAAVLGKLSRRGTRAFVVPSPIYEGSFDGNYYFVQSCAPLPLRRSPWRWNLDYERIACELDDLGTAVAHETEFAWWQGFAADPGYLEPLLSAVADRDSSDIRATLSHGDLVPWNLTCARRIWLYDWEEYEELAPLLSDRLRFAIMTSSRRNLGRSLKAFVTHAEDSHCIHREDVALALAHVSLRCSSIMAARAWDILSADWNR